MKRPEEALQIAVVAWLRVALPPDWRVHHSPNGGKRGKVEAARFKRMGTSAGFPDLILFGPSRNVVAIELKAPKGQTTPVQVGWLDHFAECGFDAFTCRDLPSVERALISVGIPLRAKVTA